MGKFKIFLTKYSLFSPSLPYQFFSHGVKDETRKNTITNQIIVQENYHEDDDYKSKSSPAITPDTTSNLTRFEAITIRAWI